MKTKKIITGLILVIFCISAIHAETCEDQGHYHDIADCYSRLHDYDNAIKYELKDIEADKRDNMDLVWGTKYVRVAELYAKKGPGFEKEILENCNLAEKQITKIIKDDPYQNAYYKDLAECFHYINYTDNACGYCYKYNEYRHKEGGQGVDCTWYYGCPKSSNGPLNNTGSIENNVGGFSFILLLGGALILVLILVAFFLLKRKHHKKA